MVLCILAGIGSALFARATDQAYYWCMDIFHYNKYFMLVYTPIIFVWIVFLLKRYFPNAGGSGLPQGYALDVFDKKELNATYSIRTMIGKIILTFLSIIGGASLGREGPTIQICASIFASLDVSRYWYPETTPTWGQLTLVLCIIHGRSFWLQLVLE